jgi:archaellum component FlaC
MDDDSIRKIEELFKRHIGVMSEDFQHKLDLVVEGQQILHEKVDRLETRMDRLETKVDAVAADLAAHRMDTEAHHGVYRVKES